MVPNSPCAARAWPSMPRGEARRARGGLAAEDEIQAKSKSATGKGAIAWFTSIAMEKHEATSGTHVPGEVASGQGRASRFKTGRSCARIIPRGAGRARP